LAVAAAVILAVATFVAAQSPDDKSQPAAKADQPAKPAAPKLGLSINEPKAYQGYTLLAPMTSRSTYLIDMQGRVVRSWETNCNPGVSAYLLENGHLLRPGTLGGEENSFRGGPGAGGRVQEFTLDGELIWDFKLFNEKQLPHHDIHSMPNGNVLMIVWDKKTAKEARDAGRRPELQGDNHLLPDSLVEVKPTGKTTGEIVWEWHLWDHLVQDFDKTKPNYASVAEHPELVNINYGEDALAPITASKDGQDKLKSLGYVGANKPSPGRSNSDWTHFNGVDYNPDLDQIIVSVHNFSEFWIIDHSTTKAEAAGHAGGKSGKGGDLLYRYGNPLAYRAGKKADQKLFAQHNAHWIPKGRPGEGHILVFNNGNGRPDGTYSSVDELVPPVDASGHYDYKPKTAYGPDKPVWSYSAPKKTEFYSFFISGAQRLPNGNTLICSGANGTIFEVTPEKDIVWKYINPVKGGGPGPGGFNPTPPQAGQVLPQFQRDALGLSADQKKQMDELQKDVDARLEKLLTADQKKQLKERPSSFGPGSPPPQAGQVLPKPEQDRLKLSDEQKTQLAALQKDVDARLEKVLTEDQRKRLKDAPRVVFGPGGPPPGGFGPPPGGPGQPGQLLPGFVRDRLQLTDDQKKQLDEFQKEADARLDKALTDEQKKQFKEPPGPGGFGALPQPGQIMSPTMQARLKLTADQKKDMEALQKDADARLDKLLTDEQKKQLKEARQGFARGGPGGFGPGGGPGGRPNFGPAGGSSLFRAYRYAADYPGLAGKDLKPGKTVEEMEKAKEQPRKP
jgi:hypothetical protein